MKYKEKAKTIEAFQLTEAARKDPGNYPDWLTKAMDTSDDREHGHGYVFAKEGSKSDGNDKLMVSTKTGTVEAEWGDYLIRTNDSIELMKQSEFEEIYEQA